MDFQGIIIKESLVDSGVLDDLKIMETKIEPVTEKHQTPWLKQWTKLKVKIPESWAEYYAEKISEVLDADQAWYADFKNEKTHYIIFYGQVFMVNRAELDDYLPVKEYGRGLGIPEYQLDFDKNLIN